MPVPLNYSWRNLWTRRFTTVLTAGGMALVTFVFAAVLMLAQGLEQTLVDTGSPDNAVALRAASETEVSSVIDRSSADLIVVQPQVAQNAAGDPLASKETLVLVTLPKKVANKPANVVIRGIGPEGMNLRPQVKLIAGRNIRPGTHEVLAGRSIAQRIQGASLGGTIRFAMTDWTIVGIIDAGRTAFDSELWADVDQLMAAFRRNIFSAIIMKVPGRKAFDEIRKRLETDPRLTVQVKREIDFYREQSEVMSRFIRILGLAMTVFFSIGAILAAMVTMYTAVANRTQEIGTLRALGFSKRNVLAAFLTESLLLGLIGGVAGIGAGSLLQFLTISTVNWATFSELAFGFELTTSIALYALGFALAMGLVGGLLPSWRASRLQIVDALRAE